MIFKKEYTVRWHDTDAYRNVRPSQLLVYMQETSNYHLDVMGHNLDRLRDEHGLAFLLSKTRVAIYDSLHFSEKITVETFTCESRGFAFNRFYRIFRGNEIIAVADTTWALIDINTRRLCKADSFDFGFEHENPIDIDLPLRFHVPKDDDLDMLGKRKIVYSDLDYNMHMNNTHYADMLCDFIPIDNVPRICGMSLSYLHEAAFGDMIKVLGAAQGDRFYFRTRNVDNTACLEAEILYR